LANRLQLQEFIDDQPGSIEQLRHLVGEEIAPSLDESLESLEKLDLFLGGLTEDEDWTSSSLFSEVSDDMSSWLTVRVAYYLAACLQKRFECEWSLSTDESSPVQGTPVLTIHGIAISPLEIASERLAGRVEGGLAGLVSDLEDEVRRLVN